MGRSSGQREGNQQERKKERKRASARTPSSQSRSDNQSQQAKSFYGTRTSQMFLLLLRLLTSFEHPWQKNAYQHKSKTHTFRACSHSRVGTLLLLVSSHLPTSLPPFLHVACRPGYVPPPPSFTYVACTHEYYHPPSGITGMRGSVIIRLRPYMISSTPPPPSSPPPSYPPTPRTKASPASTCSQRSRPGGAKAPRSTTAVTITRGKKEKEKERKEEQGKQERKSKARARKNHAARGKAMESKAEQWKAEQCNTKQCRAMQGRPMQSRAGQGTARQSNAEQCRAGQGKANQHQAKQGKKKRSTHTCKSKGRARSKHAKYDTKSDKRKQQLHTISLSQYQYLPAKKQLRRPGVCPARKKS